MVDQQHVESGARKTRTYRPFHRKWPKVTRKPTIWLMPLELIGLIPILVIFGISQPDLYRTQMWQIGFDNKLNSNPNMIIYAIANFQPTPNIPFIWSKALTDFNVAISIISLFFLLVKLIAWIMTLWYPIVALFINLSITVLYAVSVYGQVGPDYADSRYPAPAAWYFRYGCDMAKQRPGAYKNCQIAQSALGITSYMLVLYILNLAVSCYAMWPNKINDITEEDDDDDMRPVADKSEFNNGEGMPSPMSLQDMPFTPRTQAFHTLDRRFPQQQPAKHYA